MKKKTLALLMAMIMAFGAVGATIAFLTATTPTVKNTFTFGDVNIKLDEADVDEEGVAISGASRITSNDYNLIPGQKAFKDPKVTVLAKSEACYVFVKVEEANNTLDGLSGKVVDYKINEENWTRVEEGVYVYGAPTKVPYSESDTLLESIIAGDEVTVNSALTKEQIAAIKTSGKLPELKFTAYAVQADNLGDNDTPAEIWAIAKTAK